MKWIMSLFLAMLIFIPGQSWAFRNEPSGFRDLTWGESLSEIRQTRTARYVDSVEMNNDEYSMYYLDFKEREKKTISGVPIASKSISAFFYNGKLWSIAIGFHEDPNEWDSSYETLKAAMTRLYGTPSSVTNKDVVSECLWIGDTSIIELSRIITLDRSNAICEVSIKSTKVYNASRNEAKNSGW